MVISWDMHLRVAGSKGGGRHLSMGEIAKDTGTIRGDSLAALYSDREPELDVDSLATRRRGRRPDGCAPGYSLQGMNGPVGL